MSDHRSSYTLLDVAKARMREFHREAEAARLAQEARNFQPGRIKTAVNQVVNLFKLLALQLKKRFGFGRALRERAIAVRDQISRDLSI
jgi:hypothetical protein